MNKSLIILGLLWIMYGIFHSFLASSAVKSAIQGYFGLSLAQYRLGYNIFAVVTLVLLIFLQARVVSGYLFHPGLLTKTLALCIGLAGIIIMLMCVAKYFRQLSGMFKESDTPKLETGGLHKFVRHPLYLGTILFLIGMAVYWPYYKNWVAVTVISVYTLLGAILEERKLVEIFGEAYREYQRSVPMILPGPRPDSKVSNDL